MNSITYPISTGYIKHWTISNALRELVQNALDAGDMSIYYEDDTQILTILNRGQFDTHELLLGETAKHEDASKIGNYGEGLKLAAIVLLRNGMPITLVDGNSALCYTFSLEALNIGETSRDILKCDWETITVTNDPLVNVQILNCPAEEYESLKRVVLELTLPTIAWPCYDGTILKDPRHQNHIYVGGLLVCTVNYLKYGYNFKPGVISINRDRNLASDWDILYGTARLWSYFSESEELYELIEDGVEDVKNIGSYTSTNLSIILYARFKDKYGDKIPVSNDKQVNQFRASGYGGFSFVSNTYANILHRSPEFLQKSKEVRKREFRKNMRPIDALTKFQTIWEDSMNTEMKADFSELMTIAESWRIKDVKVRNV